MSLLLDFTIEGDPVPKQRPRFAKGHTYTPARTQNAEKAVKNAVYGAMRERMIKTITEPVRVEICAYFGVPASASKKRQGELIGRPCTKRPDADNVAKLVCDGMNGVAFTDDSQVASLSVSKIWAQTGSIRVFVWSLAEMG